MNKNIFLGGAIAALVTLASAGAAFASSDSYTFTIRGTVTEVSKVDKTVTVYGTHASVKSEEDLAGNVTEFNVSGAKIYKWVKGKKVRITLGGIPVGNEVVMEGAKRTNGNFNVSKITVNDNAFSLVGKLTDRSTDDKTLTVDVSYTDYKSATFKDKTVIFHYGDNTKFYTSGGSEKNSDEISAGDQRIKITGTVTNGVKWEAVKVWDDYGKAK